MTAADEATGISLPALVQRPYPELLEAAAALGVELPAQPSADELATAVVEAHLRQGALVRTEGVLELLPEGFGFARLFSRDLAPSALDAYVSPSQVRALNLRPGCTVGGPVRLPMGNERFLAMVRVDRVHGRTADRTTAGMPPFEARTPVVPTRPLELSPDDPELAALARLTPWCRGHRVLIRTAPDAAGTDFVARLAAALLRADPQLEVVLSLIDRPAERVAAARQTLAGTTARIASTPFATAPDRQVATAKLAHGYARRRVEAGRDVLLVVDSLSALVRAAGRCTAPSGAWVQPGLDAAALLLGQEVFASARQFAEGGSLTVFATAATGTETALGGVVARELRGSANAEVVLAATERGTTVDLANSRTRPEHDPRSPEQQLQSRMLRQRLVGLPPDEQLRALGDA